MKKIIVSAAVLAVLVLSSCGKSEICSCAETGLSMMKEVKDSKMDPTKMEGIQTKYKADLEKCQKMNEGKSEKELKAMETEMKACDSYKELETLSKEIMGQ
ncbi:MAG: hypothetical protein RL265_1116 [Bacteroidota bacterium]